MWMYCNFKVTFYDPKRVVIMNRWTSQERAFAVKAFNLNNYSYTEAQRVSSVHFGINRNRPLPQPAQ